MRGLAAVALFPGVMPIAIYDATLALTEGALLQSPFHAASARLGTPAKVHVTPNIEPGQPAQNA